MWDKTTQCVDTTKQAIVNMEFNVRKITTTISAKCKSVEVEPAQTGTPRTCKYFAKNGDCRYQDKCAYVHAFDKEYE